MFWNRQVAKSAKEDLLLCGVAAKQKLSLPSRCYQSTMVVDDETQSFFFDQNRVAVLVKAIILLPPPC
jgi:hypothetical protein